MRIIEFNISMIQHLQYYFSKTIIKINTNLILRFKTMRKL